METTYRFCRSSGVDGFARRDRASTDALTLLTRWAASGHGRQFRVLEDTDTQRGEPDYLIATLTATQEDIAAGSATVASLCSQLGLNCAVESTRTRAAWEPLWEAYKRAAADVNQAFGELAESDGVDHGAVIEKFVALQRNRDDAWKAFDTAHQAANSFSS